jgi:hypothetical protein
MSEPTALLGANQLFVEHRFFNSSTPSPLDWNTLDIRQAAGDHHRIVESLRPLFSGRWLSTGGSKGGMASLYHRMFYPDDVDATLAYVAPNSYGVSDERYVPYLESRGDAVCRDQVRSLQRAVLTHRAELEPIMIQRAAADGDAFDILGSGRAFEFATVEAPFALWQYGDAISCATLPAPTVPVTELFQFFTIALGSIHAWFGDAPVKLFAPYFYQSATQLGGPAYPQAHLLDLLPGGAPTPDLPDLYPPLGVAKTFDPTATTAVQRWLTAEGQRVMFVYGENDPWTAGAFEVNSARDQYRYTVTGFGGNHRAKILQLPTAQAQEALATLRRWLEPAPSPAGLTSAAPPVFDPDALLGDRGI